MKTIGMLGGMSWHSTALYYELINKGVQQKIGGLHSAKIIMASIDFAEIETLQRNGNWDRAGEILAEHSLKLQQAGADFLLICTNTMHISAPIIQQLINIPLLHIADATAKVILRQGYKTTGLLGTRFTMQMDYYKSRLQQQGLKVVVPDEKECDRVNDVIFDELCYGTIKDNSRIDYLNIINKLAKNGAECVIEGCTEITLLVKQVDTKIKLFDTTAIHADAAVNFALAE
ncbi:MAG: aspartate/glutamate racemase family protein [Gammaproteobacteria bacterium]|jgi:aspartate racemase|nr:aspartate/glutamate racemase family protein [Gammaproteobacteria bacterium]MBT3725768.1 aspartate/glutamate racemase family protein [Gammaproteobacteria bacterium]MBT4077515.1 aspartate/glutamate racemase family protein [Gammaproteobacteria bacterium]MBT4196062.1 aspartate/glutamate racemase family protein [Gammaproteobacteria bacterium]MBT4448809.1 aspartate/glutamate racemase family protein [Gammaproteobacteria bacterium]